jgi:hypothetical protein
MRRNRAYRSSSANDTMNNFLIVVRTRVKLSCKMLLLLKYTNFLAYLAAPLVKNVAVSLVVMGP